MKRIIMKIPAVIIAIILTSTICKAQISYSAPKAPTYTFICDGNIYHDYTNDNYKYVVRSNNEFEDNYIWLSLGKGKTETINSIKAMIAMYEDGNDGDKVTLGKTTFTIAKGSYSNYYYTTKQFCAGLYTIGINDLKRYVNYLENNYIPKNHNN